MSSKRSRAMKYLPMLFAWQYGLCTECSKPLRMLETPDPRYRPDRPTVDHVKPLSEGGSNWIDNFKRFMLSCNGLRNARRQPSKWPKGCCRRCGKCKELPRYRNCLACRKAVVFAWKRSQILKDCPEEFMVAEQISDAVVITFKQLLDEHLPGHEVQGIHDHPSGQPGFLVHVNKANIGQAMKLPAAVSGYPIYFVHTRCLSPDKRADLAKELGWAKPAG